MVFADRHDAGRRLAERLAGYRDRNPIVLGLPRGGVVVGYEVARALGAPLEVAVIRKLGAPGNPEFGFGAVGPGGVRVLDERTVRMLGLSQDEIDRIAEAEVRELNRRLLRYRGDRPMPDLKDRTAILVDDGIATGGTARAAVRAIRAMVPRAVVLAVPVAPPDTAAALAAEVDEFVCLHMPSLFMAVGQWYEDFSQTSDEEVIELMRLAQGWRESAPKPSGQ